MSSTTTTLLAYSRSFPISCTHAYTYIQNQKGSVMVEDKVKNEKRADEERNSEKKKRKGKERRRERELASVLETNQSSFC